MPMPRIIATTLSIALLAGCNNDGPAPEANSQSQAGATTAGGAEATGQSPAGPSAADSPAMVMWLQGNGLPPVGEYQLTSADGASIGKMTVDDAYRGIAWNDDKKLCFAAAVAERFAEVGEAWFAKPDMKWRKLLGMR